MTETLTEFTSPFPRMTSRARSAADPVCWAEVLEGWACTRETGHGGKHEAGNGAWVKYAEWE